MTSRQRGAVIVFAILILGRVLDRFDLPFEHHPGNGMPPGSTLVPGDAPPAERPEGEWPAEAAARGAQRPPASGPDTAAVSRPPRDAEAVPVVHVNRASAAELQRLPGVGPVLAGRILEHRRTHGPFRDLTDLRRVKGIGARTAARLSSSIRFD